MNEEATNAEKALPRTILPFRGNDYEVKFSWGALCEIDERYGISLTEFSDGLTKARPNTLTLGAFVLLKPHLPSLTLQEVRQEIEPKDIGKIIGAVAEAFSKAFTDTEKKTENLSPEITPVESTI